MLNSLLSYSVMSQFPCLVFLTFMHLVFLPQIAADYSFIVAVGTIEEKLIEHVKHVQKNETVELSLKSIPSQQGGTIRAVIPFCVLHDRNFTNSGLHLSDRGDVYQGHHGRVQSSFLGGRLLSKYVL